LEGNPVWLPEIGLGLGRERGVYLGREREWLYWYTQAGDRLLTPEERVQQAELQAKQAVVQANQAAAEANQAQAKAQRLAQKLKELGIDPDSV
ncbi:MAG: Uma2 family endonuclease, partial [Cyanobacteria bacterium P01_C01_bin.120]